MPSQRDQRGSYSVEGGAKEGAERYGRIAVIAFTVSAAGFAVSLVCIVIGLIFG